MRIADTVDAFSTLTSALEGTYPPTRTTLATSAALVVMFGLVVPAFVGVTFIVDDQDVGPVHTAILFAIAVSGPFLAWQVVIPNVSTFVVNSDTIMRVAPIKSGSWAISVFELATVDVILGKGDPILELKSRSDQVFRFPLQPAACHKLKPILPWLPCSDEPIFLPVWLGRLAYFLLAASVVGFVAVLFWMWKHNLLM